MQKNMKKLLLLISIGLLAALMGCSDQTAGPQSTETRYTPEQIHFFTPEEVSKELTTDGGFIGGDPTVFYPWMPDLIRFMLYPDRDISVDENFFKFRAEAGSVPDNVLIQARWMGPRGLWGYDMEPHGLNFDHPVQFMIDITTLVALNVPQDRLLMLLDNEDGTYSPIEAQIHAYQEGLLTRYFMNGSLNHFSKYVIGIGPPPGGEGEN